MRRITVNVELGIREMPHEHLFDQLAHETATVAVRERDVLTVHHGEAPISMSWPKLSPASLQGMRSGTNTAKPSRSASAATRSQSRRFWKTPPVRPSCETLCIARTARA